MFYLGNGCDHDGFCRTSFWIETELSFAVLDKLKVG